MKLNLLDFLVCLHCGHELCCLPFQVEENHPTFSHFCDFWCGAKGTGIMNSPPPLEECRLCHRKSVKEGILFCPACRMFYPVLQFIPELLPEVLRDEEREKEFLLAHKKELEVLPFDCMEILERGFQKQKEDSLSFKKSEMALTQRDDLPPGFLNPGYFLPFESLHPVRSVERILRFIITVYHLDLRREDLVLDLGAGFAWTTEWLQRLGFRSIGVDINRRYLEIGLERMRKNSPPLVVADVENPPFRKEIFHGLLFYDSFHHVAGRKKCLERMARLLRPGGRLIMAEPGAGHELHPRSQEVMETYGLLEKGVTSEEIEKLTVATNFCREKNEKKRNGEKMSWSHLRGKIFRIALYPGAFLMEKFLKIYFSSLLEQEKKSKSGTQNFDSLDLLLFLSKGDVDKLIRETDFLYLKKPADFPYSLINFPLALKKTLSLLMREFLLFWVGNYSKRKSHVRKIAYSPGEVEILLLKKKGERIYDSRSPDFLNAQLETSEKYYQAQAGSSICFNLSLKNSGNTIWLSHTIDGAGEVKIGGNLYNEKGQKVKENFFLVPIPRDIHPGEVIMLNVSLPPIELPGKYRLEIDLLSQGIMWFKDCYPQTYNILIEIIPHEMIPAQGKF